MRKEVFVLESKDITKESFSEEENLEQPSLIHKIKSKIKLSKKLSFIILPCVVLLIFGIISISTASTSAWVITVDDQEIVALTSEKKAEKALQQTLQEQEELFLEEYDECVTYTNDVDITEVEDEDIIYSSIDEASEMLAGKLDMVAPATEIMIDGDSTLYVANEKTALEALNQAKSFYTDYDEKNVFRVYTEEKIRLKPCVADSESILSAEEAAHTLLNGYSNQGETSEPLITVMVEQEKREQAILPYETIHIQNNQIQRGEKKLINAGANGTQEIISTTIEANGIEISSQETDSAILAASLPEIVEVGGTVVLSSRGSNGSGILGWPLASGTGTISSRYGWRSRGWHSGIDIAGAFGSTVYAAETGTVIYSAMDSGGYGKLVKIDHGNGIVTWYAHNNELLVSEGDYVERGAPIATIGMTGTTTGPHVHFEVYVDGIEKDPMSYTQR